MCTPKDIGLIVLIVETTIISYKERVEIENRLYSMQVKKTTKTSI